jgi:triosephosphate isomerase
VSCACCGVAVTPVPIAQTGMVAEKVQVALDNGLTPLFCIGELLEEREAGNTETVVARQIPYRVALR